MSGATNQRITACAFLHRDGRLLIAKRADTKKFLPGKFELPGGHIEYGEDIVAGLKREFWEEFGLEIAVGDAFYAFTGMNGKYHEVEVDFFAELTNPQAEITLNPAEHSEYRWVSEQEVDQVWDKQDAEYRAIKKGFELLATRK